MFQVVVSDRKWSEHHQGLNNVQNLTQTASKPKRIMDTQIDTFFENFCSESMSPSLDGFAEASKADSCRRKNESNFKVFKLKASCKFSL